jgi:aspartate/tyrosine/aromatic aminotransferase
MNEYIADKRSRKINLVAGIYLNDHNISPIFDVVKKVEDNLVKHEKTKATFRNKCSDIFKKELLSLITPTIKKESYQEVIQTLGGSGALSLTGELIAANNQNDLWLSTPTWDNHYPIFSSKNISIRNYLYQSLGNQFDLSLMLNCLKSCKENDFILLQPCCHNPTGINITDEQWKIISQFCQDRKLIPIFDMAYLGLGRSFEEDISPLKHFINSFNKVYLCISFSKIMGLYDDRVGFLLSINQCNDSLQKEFSQIKAFIRSSYSVPPAHGYLIVESILCDFSFKQEWLSELCQIKEHINNKRKLFFNEVCQYNNLNGLINFFEITGMFIVLNLDKLEINKLKIQFGVYILPNGRLSIATLDYKDIPYVVSSISKIKS